MTATLNQLDFDAAMNDFSVHLENPPALFDLKLVYSYVIEVADSESDLDLHGKPLVSEIMVFLRIRVTCIFLLNDFFYTTIRKNACFNTPSQ